MFHNFIQFLLPDSRIDSMAGFHHPGDPYYPNQGNEGWIVDDPEEEPMEDEEEEDSDSSASEPEVINPSAVRPPSVQPPFRMGFHGTNPIWGSHIHHWSQQ